VSNEIFSTSSDDTACNRLETEPLDGNITSVQPGGGTCMQLELFWGKLRRWYLRTFRRGYVERMKQLRQVEPIGCPHDVLDPRDLKFFRNITGDCWDAADDPFRWRSALPFARAGLTELFLMSGVPLFLAIVAGLSYWPLAIPLLGLAFFFVWFFRDPIRSIPAGPGMVVSPADGRVVALDRIEHDPYVGGPVVVVGIFLSVFNVHINRAPAKSRVIGLTYQPGKFLNALRPISARENERMILRLESDEKPYRRYIVRQIAGALARRIVCQARPGDQLARGERFGMIKLGSRTELVLPAEHQSLVIKVTPGQKVKAGSSILAVYQ
jgi:phosphatidylserine decarboxylase